MRPTLVQYDAPGWGVGEVWLDGDRVVHSELPRPRRQTASHFRVSDDGLTVVRRLERFFAGKNEDFADVPLDLPDGFLGACAQALRAVPRGEVVTYGELAALAGRPRAARAAGTFCARCDLSPFVPTHRVVSANGLGPYGDLGPGYKRRLLALEGVAL
ncbi:MAG TPA: methylated-DNA--[protein]-cysteine S-methyltransferase [Gaiellaceae bacterium]|nr:methylated-DNA--[protein]-cysteine S-methyltransferase [Gaiellaceae bacterium]